MLAGYNWELYNLNDDPTENDDLAAKVPDKLKELQTVFYAEAKKYQVFPLDNSTLPRIITERPSATAGRSQFTYTGEITGIPTDSAPSILQRSYTITAVLDIPDGGAEGMIVTQGGRFGGYGLFLSQGRKRAAFLKLAGLSVLLMIFFALLAKAFWRRFFKVLAYAGALGALTLLVLAFTIGVGRGRPVFLYNLFDLQRTAWVGRDALGSGKHTVVFDFKFDGGGFGKGGTGTLSVDGKETDRKHIEHTVPFIFQWDESFDIGQDTGTAVSLVDYEAPFKFTGKIDKVTFDLQPRQLSALEEREFEAKSQRNNIAAE